MNSIEKINIQKAQELTIKFQDFRKKFSTKGKIIALELIVESEELTVRSYNNLRSIPDEDFIKERKMFLEVIVNLAKELQLEDGKEVFEALRNSQRKTLAMLKTKMLKNKMPVIIFFIVPILITIYFIIMGFYFFNKIN